MSKMGLGSLDLPSSLSGPPALFLSVIQSLGAMSRLHGDLYVWFVQNLRP